MASVGSGISRKGQLLPTSSPNGPTQLVSISRRSSQKPRSGDREFPLRPSEEWIASTPHFRSYALFRRTYGRKRRSPDSTSHCARETNRGWRIASVFIYRSLCRVQLFYRSNRSNCPQTSATDTWVFLSTICKAQHSSISSGVGHAPHALAPQILGRRVISQCLTPRNRDDNLLSERLRAE